MGNFKRKKQKGVGWNTTRGVAKAINIGKELKIPRFNSPVRCAEDGKPRWKAKGGQTRGHSSTVSLWGRRTGKKKRTKKIYEEKKKKSSLFTAHKKRGKVFTYG